MVGGLALDGVEKKPARQTSGQRRGKLGAAVSRLPAVEQGKRGKATPSRSPSRVGKKSRVARTAQTERHNWPRSKSVAASSDAR